LKMLAQGFQRLERAVEGEFFALTARPPMVLDGAIWKIQERRAQGGTCCRGSGQWCGRSVADGGQ